MAVTPSLDSFGNYKPDLGYTSTLSAAVLANIGVITGAPDANTPTFYGVVMDSATGNLYGYVNGAWQSIGGGGSSSGTVTTSAVDPNGVITITGPGWCIGTGASAGLHWEKVTAGSGSVWNAV